MLGKVAYSFLSRFGVAIMGFLMVVLTSRYFGAAGRGEISLVTTTLMLINMFQDVLSGSALINLSRKKPLLQLVTQAFTWNIIMCLLAYGILNLPVCYSPHAGWIVLFAFFYSGINTFNSLLIGLQQVNRRNTFTLLMPLLTFMLILGIMQLGLVHDITGYFIAVALSSAMVFALAARALSKYLDFREPVTWWSKEVFITGISAQTGHLVNFFNYRLSFYIVLYYAGKENLGVYAIAILLVESVWMIGNSLAQIQHMKIVNTAEPVFKLQLTISFFRLSFWATAAAGIVLVLLPGSFWHLLLKDEAFAMLSAYLLPLLPSMLFMGAGTLISHYFHATNRFHLLTRANILGLIANAIMLPFAVSAWSVNGAIWCTNLAYAIMFIFYLVRFKKEGADIGQLFSPFIGKDIRKLIS